MSKEKLNGIKWQINAETSISQIMLSVIIIKLYNGWSDWLLVGFIIGNIWTLGKSLNRLPKDYFRKDKCDAQE